MLPIIAYLPSMKQVRHAMATLRYKALSRQTIDLHRKLSKQSRHTPELEDSGTALSCFSPASAGSPAGLQRLRLKI